MELTIERLQQQEQIDNAPLADVVSGLIGFPAILVAHELEIFPLLRHCALSLEEICQAKDLTTRAAEAMLTMCLSTGLLSKTSELYNLTPLSRQYLLKESPYYYGSFLDLLINNYDSITLPSVKQAILGDKNQAYDGKQDVFDVHAQQVDLAEAFTRAMHSSSHGPAQAWTQIINLSQYKNILDIGGGSGAHSIAALEQWPHLKATLLDLPPVCKVADEFAANHSLSGRLSTQTCDIWHDTFPEADIHFYSQIYHDWPEDKCLFLTKKSYQSLPSGGKIILHEVLYNTDKSGPLAAAAGSIGMLLWTQGRQYSGHELSEMLSKAGFTNVEVIRTGFAYWSVITAQKP